jgi:primosomal protein N' (replication factor Y)
MSVVRVAVPRPLWTLFDYRVPDEIATPVPGTRVRVPFGAQTLIGLVVESAASSADDVELKAVTDVLDPSPALQADVLDLIRWAAAYYRHPIGEAVFAAIPAALRKRAHLRPIEPPRFWQACNGADAPTRAPKQTAAWQRIRDAGEPVAETALMADGFDTRVLRALERKGAIERTHAPTTPRLGSAANFTPTAEQRLAIEAARAALGRFECLLIDGVTGSGKTEVYLQAIETALERGQQALVLIPEIALTPQTLDRFRQRFGDAATYHSALGERERVDVWQRCRSGAAKVLIGTRSAIFVPFAALGLIVVDEEHDGSFKQQDGFRYSARDLAIKRAQMLAIPLLLGTATPALETLNNARRGRYRHLHLTARPGAAKPPIAKLVDIRGIPLDDGISAALKKAIATHLANGNQALLFINRRGYSPTYMCTRCGWTAACSRCESRLTLHRAPPGLRCHHCGFAAPLPRECPDCGFAPLHAIGVGTQRSEQGIARAFPSVPVLRIDRDTTRSARTMTSHLEMIARGEPAILIGTQMLAKGHHFPRVTLVGVLNADAGFASPDFRAPEHTAQLIVQVAGRAGRADRAGEVWIQTFNPNNPLLRALVHDGYPGFAATELDQRAAAGLPPFRALALLKADGADLERTLACLRALVDGVDGVEILGPIPAPLARRARLYRCQTALVAADRAHLGRALDRIVEVHANERFGGVRWSIDVDPYDMS